MDPNSPTEETPPVRAMTLPSSTSIRPRPGSKTQHHKYLTKLPSLTLATQLSKNIDTEQAITEGVDVAYGRVMLLGASGVGKTSLIRGLKNELFVEDGNSTQLAELKHINQSWAEGKYKHQWKEVSEADELDELAKLLVAVSISNSKSAEQIISDVTSVQALYPSNQYHMVAKELANKEAIRDFQEKEINVYLQKALDRAKILSPSFNILDLKPAPFLHIWDCGGQTIFLEVLPAFLTPRTMFLLLFDASKSFEEIFTSVQLKQGKKVVEEDVGITILQLLKSWLAMIHVHLERKENAVLLDYPRVSLIGTHGDKEIRKEQEVIEKLKDSFQLIQSDYVVDNTKSGKGKNEDPCYKMIREEIYNFAMNSLVVKTPLSWVLFRKIITKTSKCVVSYSEAKAMAIACRISEEDVPKALAFFHDLGVILFYPQIQGLNDKVILNPEWFVKCLGKVLSLKGNEEYDMKGMWKLFREKGILLQSLYGAVWKGNKGGIPPESIMELMVHLHLAANVKTEEYHDHDISQYFVPCSLKNFVGKAQPLDFKMKASVLHIKFNLDFVPPGYFTRFVTTIASYEACSLNFKPGVYRNRVCFEFGFDVKYDHIVLTETSSTIQIEIGRNILDNDNIPSFSNSCQDFLTIVKASCSEVDDLFYHQSITSDISVPTAINIYSRVKMICSQDYCSNKSHDQPLTSSPHYLKIDDLCKQDLSKDARVSCERSDDFRPLGNDEQHWFSIPPERVSKKNRVSEVEMVKLSQCIKDGDSLAASLELLNEWDGIIKDSQVTNKTLRLLQRYDSSGGTRAKLVRVFCDLKENVLADQLSTNKFTDDSIPSRDDKKILQRRGHAHSLLLPIATDNHPSDIDNTVPKTAPAGEHNKFLYPENNLQPPVPGDENQHQLQNITSHIATDYHEGQNGDERDITSSLASSGIHTASTETKMSPDIPSVLKDTDLMRCSRHVKMDCNNLAAFLDIEKDVVHKMKIEYPVKSAHVYRVLLLWSKKQPRTKQDLQEIFIALQQNKAAKSLMDPNWNNTDQQQSCSLM